MQWIIRSLSRWYSVLRSQGGTGLSRPAVSHHLKLLKDAGVVKVRREGTRNYYYLDPDMKSFKALISVLERSVEYASELPYRGEV